MHKSGKEVSFVAAVSIGIGAMVGAGIFALLGEAGTIAGNATWISFFISGIIALLSGYSFGKLGARYPSAGGIVEYLSQSYGNGIFAGAMSIMMYIAATIAIALVAKAFGSYAWSMLPHNTPEYWKLVLGAGIIILFVLINLNGAKSVGRLEIVIVGVKLLALSAFAIIGLLYISPEKLAVANYPPVGNIFYALAITFFAYEGFRVITNAAEDMKNPGKTLPAAILTSIAIAMVLYILIAIVMFGTLSVEKVVEAKDYALAEAARPLLGSVGFRIVAITALIATASSINASLYAVTNITYKLAKNGQLPEVFGKPIAYSREGLLISGVLIILMVVFLNLNEIAILGSVSILIIHLITHIGHLKLIKNTGASFIIVLLACITNLAAITLTLVYESKHSPHIVIMLVACLAASFLIEIILQVTLGKIILPRITIQYLHDLVKKPKEEKEKP
jgi:amino acid transporter